jgi:hypothetical protein
VGTGAEGIGMLSKDATGLIGGAAEPGAPFNGRPTLIYTEIRDDCE